MTGPDPLFDDIEVYTCVYNGNFHEYLDRESLEIYVFDNSISIKVDSDGKEVEMVRNNNETDLIGICRVKLRGLILNNKIEGKYPILNEEGTLNMGYLIVSMIAEEIILDDDKKIIEGFDSRVIEGIAPVLVKLAALLRDKGLNMNSAFKIFDKDNEGQISLDNFRSELLFTFKFNNDDVNKLVDIIFKNKVVIDKQDFYQIFNNLLPFSDDFNFTRKTNILGENTEISFNVIDRPNMTGNINNVNNYNTTGALKQIPNNTQNYNYTNYNINNNILGNTNINNLTKTNNLYNISNTGSPGRRRSRTMNEIMIKVEDYMLYFGKRTATDLFKIFDQDANLRVGIKELADGFGKMNIALNPEELQMIWKHIVGYGNKDSFGIDEFMQFYEKNKVKKDRK